MSSGTGVVFETAFGFRIPVRIKDGWYCGSTMCDYYGKTWNEFYRAKKDYIMFLNDHLDTPVVEKRPWGLGFWVHPDLAMELARWVSPELEMAFKQMVARKFKRDPPPQVETHKTTLEDLELRSAELKLLREEVKLWKDLKGEFA